MKQILSLLPDEYAKQVKGQDLRRLEEIRISAGRPLLLRACGQEQVIWPTISAAGVEEVLRRACRQSVYAHLETIRHGYVTVEGGHRIGLCGTGVLQDGEVQNMVKPSSLVIRIAKEWLGFADELRSVAFGSVLLIGPPCSGKTSLLRDLVRQLSDERKQRVSLVDERGEIAAVLEGTPQNSIGLRTDVLVNVPKRAGIMMMLRTMNPQWIAVDEITAPGDIQALEQASYCGVRLLATAHADSPEDLYQRPLYKEMMKRNIFSHIIHICPDRTYRIQEVKE